MAKFKISMPKSRNGRIVSAVGGVIGLCLIFACASSVLSPNTETPSQVAEVPERAAAPVVLDTPTRAAPTRTPVPPTDTPVLPTDTPIPAPTDTPILAPTDAPTEVSTVAPTEVPTAVPTSTPVPVSGPSASSNANLRSGPGTGFAVAGSVQPGEQLEIVGRTPAGDWLKLATGLWIASSLVNDAPDAPVIEVPTAPPAPPTATSAPQAAPTATPAAPAPPGPATFADVRLIVAVNSGMFEILEVRNNGAGPIDISGWDLRGSKGDDFCIIPGGTVLQPNEGFQIATGDSQPTARGYKCGDKPIWNNDGETIFLKALDGQVKQIVTG